jgi:hypothetical protein
MNLVNVRCELFKMSKMNHLTMFLPSRCTKQIFAKILHLKVCEIVKWLCQNMKVKDLHGNAKKILNDNVHIQRILKFL